MFERIGDVQFLDLHPESGAIFEDVIEGLTEEQKWLSSMYFYDQKGSDLFQKICQQPEYYLTQSEIDILETNIRDIVHRVGTNPLIIDLGSGASRKIQLLLDHLDAGAKYMAIDISKEILLKSTQSIAEKYPTIETYAVCADFTQIPNIENLHDGTHNVVFFFPGSTIGNFDPGEAVDIMKSIRAAMKPGDSMIIGIDLEKDADVLNAAYNDAAGVTAEFNKNILNRINNDVDADFDLDKFEHIAFYNPEHYRVEMHLKSTAAHAVGVQGFVIYLSEGETIHTENSYKYNEMLMSLLFGRSGFELRQQWTDAKRWFSVNYVEAV